MLSTLFPFYGEVIGWFPLIIVLCFAIPLVALTAARPQIGVLILVALVPWHGLLVIINHPAFSEGYKQFLTGWIILWAFLSVVGKKRPTEKRPRYLPAVIGYVAIGVVSAALHRGTQALTGLQTSYFYLLLPIALWWSPFDEKDRDRFVSIMMFNAFATSLYGLYQQVIGASGLISMGYQYGRDIRTTGPWLRSFSSFGDPQAFGLFLMLCLLICVPVALDDLTRRRNKLFLFVTPVILIACAFSFTRSAWVGLAIGATYLAFHRYNVLLFFAPFALVALLVLPTGFSQAASYSGSLQDRKSGWAQNLNAAANPIGNGIGTTGSAAEKALKVQKRTGTFYQPDNHYFKVLYELGVIGLYFFVMTLIACLLFTRDAERRAPPAARGFISGATAHVLAVMGAAFTSMIFEIFPDDLLFWVLMGAVASCYRNQDASPENAGLADQSRRSRPMLSNQFQRSVPGSRNV